MDHAPDADATQLLEAAAGGSTAARETLLELLYEELRSLAASCLLGERADHTLQPTALANEAWLRLMRGAEPPAARTRRQFFALVATAMRRILINHARDRARLKRGGGARRVSLELAMETPDHGGAEPIDLIALTEALDDLAVLDPRKARLVELRFFAGMTIEDAADVVEISRSVAADDWRLARAWLAVRLDGA